MGRGSGGGGRGGRRAAKGGGGGDVLTEERMATTGVLDETPPYDPNAGLMDAQVGKGPVPELLPGEKFPGQKAFEAANPNLKILPDGTIEVGSAGAPKLDMSRFPDEAAAVEYLKNLGMQQKPLRIIDGLNSAREVASAIPEGSRILGQGTEGIGILFPDGSVARLQYGGPAPSMYYAGDAAVYSTWKMDVGQFTLEGKPFIEHAYSLYEKGLITKPMIEKGTNVSLRKAIEARARKYNPELRDVDLHAKNIGWDSKTSTWVEFDPGGLNKAGRQANARWNDPVIDRRLNAAEARGLAKEMRRNR